MIFTDRTIIVQKGTSSINDTIVLYRGDREVQIRFTLNEGSPFKFGSGASPNIIEKTEAAYGQLIIKTPNDLPAIFSEVAPTNNGKIVFTITAEMIDEITEVGNYTFQIRLLDESRNSRATIPEVVNGIEIREPIATEDVTTTNEVGEATVGYALTTAGTQEDTFDSQGNYNKTTWGTGDRITAAKLNKIEAGIDGVNKKVASGGTGGEVDLSGYVTKEVGNANQITFADGQTFQAKLDAGTLKGEKGDQGERGADGLTTSISLNGVTYTQENGVITLPNITSGGDTPSVAHIEPEELDMPKVFFNGDKPTNKTSVQATIEYISKTEHFKGYVDIKCQGTSSMAYPKKNYTIKMFSDEARSTKLKKDFKGWGKQSKFCLKANYIDHSHARNIVSAKLWGQVVKSRSDFDTLPEELKTSPNYGAVDGFPIKVYYNGTYEGVYTWNIPKDGWMNNMDDKLDTHCILCGEEYSSGCFREANASLWSDELHDVMPANIVTSFNAFQNFVINSSDDEFKTGLSTYADVNSLIDYYIFQYAICGLDSMGKNQLFFTYDGTKWIASSYDMDSTFGLYWNGQSFVSTTYRMQEDYESMTSGRPGNLLYMRMEQLFCDEIKARYAELRAGVLSYANIVNEFERFMDTIGKDLYAEDLTIYTGIPSGNTNNIQQIRNYTRDRLTYVDTQIEALTPPVEPIPCTGIVLSADTLSFTTTDTQTLSVVVSPENCTDTVTWSVSPGGIVTVNNGVVTPIGNGECTITATCGSYSDTCAVTVSGISGSGGDTGIYATAEYAITEPRTFNGTSDYIDTGIKLFDTAKTFTVFVDYASDTASANNQCTVFHCMHEVSPWRGLCLMRTSSTSDTYFIGGTAMGNGYVANIPSTGKYLISFVNGVINNIVTLNNSNELVYSATDMASDNPYAQVTENLLLGCYQDTSGTKGRFWSGTINKFGVWYKQLTSDEINKVFGKNGGDTVPTLETFGNLLSTISTWNVMGDSITDETIEPKTKYPTILKNKYTNMTTVNNYGHSGWSVAVKSDSSFGSFLTLIDSMSSSCDLITIAGGVNDFLHSVPIGERSSTLDTEFYGAVNNLVTRLRAKYPNTPIIWIIPLPVTDGVYESNDDGTNPIGNTLDDYRKALRNKLHDLQVPAIDLSTDPDMDPSKISTDGLHPTAAGQEIYANKLNDSIPSIPLEEQSISQHLVFKIDSTCMDTNANTLTDKISGIRATLTGNPTVGDGQITFTKNDTFTFDLNSLSLTTKNRTVRVKFTLATLDDSLRNVIILGGSTINWDDMTSCYASSTKLIVAHGSNNFSDNTVGSEVHDNADNRLSTVPVTGQEYELVISEHVDGNVRWFIDGTLVQDGTTTLFAPLYLGNAEGQNRFAGSYSLIEIYNGYCNDYAQFTNMVNN